MSTFAAYAEADAVAKLSDGSGYTGPGDNTYLHEWGPAPTPTRNYWQWAEANIGGQMITAVQFWPAVDATGQSVNGQLAWLDLDAAQVPFSGPELIAFPGAEPWSPWEEVLGVIGNWVLAETSPVLGQSLQAVVNREGYDNKAIGLLLDAVEDPASGQAGFMASLSGRPAYLVVDYEVPPSTGSYDVVGTVSVSVSRG